MRSENPIKDPIAFSGVFSLRDGVTEQEFLPSLHAFYGHLIERGFATSYRILRREPLEGFGKTLPAFSYRGELRYPTAEREAAAYAYVKEDSEPIRSLHRCMNSKVSHAADFFLERCIAQG
jgi:hypothetical protein